MEESSQLDCLIQNFIRFYNESVKDRLVRSEHIVDYYKSCRISLHSILQFALIRAGIKCGFASIPEYKLLLKEPIDKADIDERFKEVAKGGKVRKQWQVTIDVAFIKDSELSGLGEVYTLDEIHGCKPSREMSDLWLTPYHKLPHMIEHSINAMKFLVIVNVFPKTVEKEKLPWRDSKKHSVTEWKTCWKKLVRDLRDKGVKLGHIMIYEDGAEKSSEV